ncbi:hypothetical protein EGI16_21395 [Chryseobacterium sp. G0240]|uniref:hypothetical protein n=1 Tax=Chryseobacterium sp. G0240 TaxID=2487066 RepID=UPI000F449BBA|nr:hypothetical protein [Chryseobacterium sp. G0240]ROH98393.1 hypothetical protein EGI16_21395 [Chryseobacterium sp. G0240]
MRKFDNKIIKRKVTLTIEFEKDKLDKTFNPIQLENSLLTVLKQALNEDRLIIKETVVRTSTDIYFDTIII